ncbi:hypothetical protein F511_46005 [Dorcoceras hygrometricum]|uniref:Uncharacterized protein n=1 Tax=Dorcoceras hygrometricum TaxID=472368 RepID=A0A2Z6ZV39_9LAMI|nr:hypothetical protein F511_46005 [Dorcoceras hygrometricum]
MARWWPLRTAAASAGRAPLREERAAMAETLRDGWPIVVRYVAHGCATGWRNHWSDVDARWSRDGRAVARGRASRLAWVVHAAAANFVVAAAACRSPLRRVSGDIVTAGLISSRVWFGPVPGSP